MAERRRGMRDRLVSFLAPSPGAQGPRSTPPAADSPRWARPLSFTVELAPDLYQAWTGGGAYATRVSRAEALRVPAVKRARDLIATTIGRLEFVELDPQYNQVMNDLLAQPEEDVARSVTYAMTAEDLLFEGVAWWRVTEWNGPALSGWPRRVVRLDARSVNVGKDGRMFYTPGGKPQGQATVWLQDAELIRFDSPCEALLVAGAGTIREALALSRATTRNVDNPFPMGYITGKDDAEIDESDDEVQELADEFRDAMFNGGVPYLNQRLDLKTIGWNPEQLQLTGARDGNVLEVARMTGVDAEELSVSTTSRTYANEDQRILGLLDFTIQPYVTAMTDRLSMGDVTFPGNRVVTQADAFRSADTAGRLDIYAKGIPLGLYPPERLSRLEQVPVGPIRKAQTPAKPVAAPATAEPAPPAGTPANDQEDQPVKNTLGPVQPGRSAAFAATGSGLTVGFVLAPEAIAFKADAAKRTVSGLVLPWNTVASSGGYKWKFAPNSLHWGDDTRVKLDRDHGYGTEFGAAVPGSLAMSSAGLSGTFKVARGTAGDDALALAEDGVYDGFSAYVTFDGEADGWEPDPDDSTVRLVRSATLRKVALTAMPAFDDARVQSVAATRKDNPMDCLTCGKPHANGTPCPTPSGTATPPAAFDAEKFATAFTAGLGPALTEAIKPLIAALPQPQTPARQIVPAGRRPLEVSEPMVYNMNGQGPSFVKDAWRARTEGDHEARDRVARFQRQTEDMVTQVMADPAAAFAITTGNAGALVPPGFRPDLYVTQIMRGRPMTNALSRGTINDASPFTIPAFVSAANATADHVEGVNPTEGTLSVGTLTVTPGAVSGLYRITREIADSSNPAIDAIATQAMSESYSQQSEAKVYNKLNGTAGVGGVITGGFVPSGAQVSTTTGDGNALGYGVRDAMAKYPYRRFGDMDFGFLSQEASSQFAAAKDTTNRPTFPWTSASNPIGGPTIRGVEIDGMVYQRAWSMTGNAAGDADVIAGNRNDVWYWESPTLMFRFEERSGPAFVELALFGYFAVEILRPLGLVGIRHTAS